MGIKMFSSTLCPTLLVSMATISRVSSSPLSSVPGIPGQDYPTLDFYNLPSTTFDCQDRVNGGFYSDEEAFCQMYHMFVVEPSGTYKKYSFLCPNGTIFNQEKLVCDTWFNVDCSTDTVETDAGALDLLDAERTFITLGLESDDPQGDFPWRFRDEDY